MDTVDIGKQLERVKWFLWHGNLGRALDTIDDVEGELDLLPQIGESRKKLLKAVREFRGYIEANQNFIPNYRDRYRHGLKCSLLASLTCHQSVFIYDYQRSYVF